MRQMFFVLFLIVFVSSCEDEINSSNDDIPTNLGCDDEMAENYEFLANGNDGSCIYDNGEYQEYLDCQDQEGEWSQHTCTNPADNSNALSWDGDDITCNELGYTYTFGSCTYPNDGGSDV